MHNSILRGAAAIGVLAVSASYASEEGEGLTTVSETRELCATAASQVADGAFERAFGALAPHWPLPQSEIRAIVAQSESQLGQVGSRFGAPIGTEHVSTSEAGSSFVGHLYAIKYENHALRFTCRFYKPRDQWLVNSVNWDDQAFISF